jgi:hypothetical protein
MSSSSSSDTLQATMVVFVIFSTLQNVNICPHFVAVRLLLLLLNIVVLFILAVAAIWYGLLVAVIARVWCLFLLLNSSFNHNYYDYLGMSISKAPPAWSCFEELFKVLLKIVA